MSREFSTKPWHKKWGGALLVIFAVIILSFLSASAFYFIKEIKNAKSKISQTEIINNGQKYNAVSSDNYWLGSANAKITIVEFGDFTCPVSKKSFSTIREISLKYKNDIKFIWRDYPVYSESSAALALIARCAGEQGLFWPMHDKLFQNQGVIELDGLIALANQIGANTERLRNCVQKQKYLPQITKDLADGKSFNISGTPAYFINGYKIEGDIPYETVVKIIEELK